MKYGSALPRTAKARISKRQFHKVPACIRLSFCLQRRCKSPLSPPLSFPTVFSDFLAAFLQEHESILRNTIVYGDIRIYRNSVKTLRKLAFRVRDAFRSVTREPSNRSLPYFHCCTIKHRYTDFRSYLNFHRMQDVPGFRSAGHICYCKPIYKQVSIPVHAHALYFDSSVVQWRSSV